MSNNEFSNILLIAILILLCEPQQKRMGLLLQGVGLAIGWYLAIKFLFPCVAFLWIKAGAGWTILICAIAGVLTLAAIGTLYEKWERLQERRKVAAATK
jgi:hypothetical protein